MFSPQPNPLYFPVKTDGNSPQFRLPNILLIYLGFVPKKLWIYAIYFNKNKETYKSNGIKCKFFDYVMYAYLDLASDINL